MVAGLASNCFVFEQPKFLQMEDENYYSAKEKASKCKASLKKKKQEHGEAKSGQVKAENTDRHSCVVIVTLNLPVF